MVTLSFRQFGALLFVVILTGLIYLAYVNSLTVEITVLMSLYYIVSLIAFRLGQIRA
jgi:hypothetical protein